MKKKTFTANGGKLELKKTAIAKLSLTKAQMMAIAGGGVEPTTTGDDTSKAIVQTCTSVTHTAVSGTL